MLSKSQAILTLKTAMPGIPIKACADYHDLYLFRVEYPALAERNWDPFFSVDKLTGEVRDFSVLTDGNTTEINNLDWHEL